MDGPSRFTQDTQEAPPTAFSSAAVTCFDILHLFEGVTLASSPRTASTGGSRFGSNDNALTGTPVLVPRPEPASAVVNREELLSVLSYTVEMTVPTSLSSSTSSPSCSQAERGDIALINIVVSATPPSSTSETTAAGGVLHLLGSALPELGEALRNIRSDGACSSSIDPSSETGGRDGTAFGGTASRWADDEDKNDGSIAGYLRAVCHLTGIEVLTYRRPLPVPLAIAMEHIFTSLALVRVTQRPPDSRDESSISGPLPSLNVDEEELTNMVWSLLRASLRFVLREFAGSARNTVVVLRFLLDLKQLRSAALRNAWTRAVARYGKRYTAAGEGNVFEAMLADEERDQQARQPQPQEELIHSSSQPRPLVRLTELELDEVHEVTMSATSKGARDGERDKYSAVTETRREGRHPRKHRSLQQPTQEQQQINGQGREEPVVRRKRRHSRKETPSPSATESAEVTAQPRKEDPHADAMSAGAAINTLAVSTVSHELDVYCNEQVAAAEGQEKAHSDVNRAPAGVQKEVDNENGEVRKRRRMRANADTTTSGDNANPLSPLQDPQGSALFRILSTVLQAGSGGGDGCDFKSSCYSAATQRVLAENTVDVPYAQLYWDAATSSEHGSPGKLRADKNDEQIEASRNTPSEARGQNEGLATIPDLPLPHAMATLFYEVTPATAAGLGHDARARQLFRQWSGSTDVLAPSLVKAGTGGNALRVPPLMPPPHRRLIVLLAPDAPTLTAALLSWTRRPYAENALIVPILGASPSVVLASTRRSCNRKNRKATHTTAPLSAVSQPVLGKRGSSRWPTGNRGARRSVTFNDMPTDLETGKEAESAIVRPLVILMDAVCCAFHVDASVSAAVCTTEAFTRAIQRSSYLHPLLWAHTSHSSAAGAGSRVWTPSTAIEALAQWAGECPSLAAATASSSPDGVEALREELYREMAGWCALAAALRARPRRPAVALRHVTVVERAPAAGVANVVSSVTSSSRQTRSRGLAAAVANKQQLHSNAPPTVTAEGAVTLVLGLVRPAARQSETLAGGSDTFQTRLDAAQAPPVPLLAPPQLSHRSTGTHDPQQQAHGLSQRAQVFAFLSALFGADVFRTAVDVMRTAGPDYVSSYRCGAVGYLRYDLSAWLRGFVSVSLSVDLSALVTAAVADTPTAAARAMSSFSSPPLQALRCTCTPRPFERVQYSPTTGEKRCRHLAELLYYFLEQNVTVAAVKGRVGSPWIVMESTEVKHGPAIALAASEKQDGGTLPVVKKPYERLIPQRTQQRQMPTARRLAAEAVAAAEVLQPLVSSTPLKVTAGKRPHKPRQYEREHEEKGKCSTKRKREVGEKGNRKSTKSNTSSDSREVNSEESRRRRHYEAEAHRSSLWDESQPQPPLTPSQHLENVRPLLLSREDLPTLFADEASDSDSSSDVRESGPNGEGGSTPDASAASGQQPSPSPADSLALSWLDGITLSP